MDAALIHEFVAQRFAIGKAVHLTDFEGIAETAQISVSHPYSMAMDQIVIALKAYCLAEVHEAKSVEVKHFASWWDHFKADYFPGPLLARFPAVTWTQTVFEPITVRVCPHIHIPTEKNRAVHLKFLGAP